MKFLRDEEPVAPVRADQHLPLSRVLFFASDIPNRPREADLHSEREGEVGRNGKGDCVVQQFLVRGRDEATTDQVTKAMLKTRDRETRGSGKEQ